MMLTVIWSDFATNQLDEVFEYYKEKASLRVAKKIAQKIISESAKLSKSPYIGQKEERLKQRKTAYRYMVVKHYKLIYSVNEKKGLIQISDVFDTRQYPPKTNRTQ